MKLPRLVILLALALAGARGRIRQLPTARRHAHSNATSRILVVGHAYVNDNTAVSNTVAGFDRHADGSLTPIPGSPFPAGGAGSGAGPALTGRASSSRATGATCSRSTPPATRSRCCDSASAACRSRSALPCPRVAANPLSIAVSGNLVYVANAGASAPNVTGFILAPDGRLYPLPGSTVALPAGSGPDDVLFDPHGPAGSSSTSTTPRRSRAFTFAATACLVAAPGSPIAAQGAGPFGAEFRPTNPSQLFVSNAHNGGAATERSRPSSWRGSGQLAPIGASPFADLQTAPCWVEISHDGQFLFTVNTGSGEISSYSINPDGSLVLLGSTPFGSAGAGAVDARLSPDGRTLLVDGSKANVIASFAVNGGSLTELPSSPTPLPAGAVRRGHRHRLTIAATPPARALLPGPAAPAPVESDRSLALTRGRASPRRAFGR